MKNNLASPEATGRQFASPKILYVALAILVPAFYLITYTPYGMDTTDFGYFYGYAWRVLNGQMPYRDFFYIKPAFPLYWHAFWLGLTPESVKVLMGKAGFLLEMLSVAWLGAMFINKFFDLKKLRLPLSLLATSGFVFGIHTFPHMPWHTADGALFSMLGLFCVSASSPILAGLFIALAVLCKQSFLLLPAGVALFYFLAKNLRQMFKFSLSFLGAMFIWTGWLALNGAWQNFLDMTTGQLDWREAVDAGILIYLRQNWLPPLLAIMPWLICKLLNRQTPRFLLPCYCYLFFLGIFYIHMTFTQKTWIGFGLSWPTLFIVLGALEISLPKSFLSPWLRSQYSAFPVSSAIISLGLLAAWSCAISGGYKIPAFIAVIPLFCFYLIHAKMGGDVRRLGLASLITGVVMFGCGYQYPYTFPQRELSRTQLNRNAGEVFPLANHVYVDQDMYERLRELKNLRSEFGSNYKTLPGFPMANFLNGDPPGGKSDWYTDWEINSRVDEAYKDLLDGGYVVFMERDQADVQKADNYDRTGYSVPQLVRKNWRLIKETPHFLVYLAPSGGEEKNADDTTLQPATP